MRRTDAGKAGAGNDDAAYAAIADPTRRAILDVLRDRSTLTAGEIAAHFPAISRPAVSKHLGILRRAHLVQASERGREWHYVLDPNALAAAYHGWFAKFAPLWDESLKELKRRSERRH